MKPVDRNHIVWAYRLFLGREPESEAVIEQHLARHYPLKALREAFMQSDEFRGLATAQRAESARPVPRRVQIEQVQSPQVLDTLLQHVAREWSALGEQEPHWSVLTNEQFRSQHIDQSLDVFRKSGVDEVRHIAGVLERNGLQWPRDGLCLEYGCGVGRVTLPLAAQCGRVVGVDVSAAHLRLAQEEAVRQDMAHKLQWMQVRTPADLQALPPADLVYSRIVLQHNPPPVIELVLLQLLRGLKPGGVAIFQLPTFIPGYRFRVDEYLQALRAGNQRGMEMHMLPQARIFELVQQAGCQPCEVFADEAAGPVYTSHTFVVKSAP